MWLRLHVHCHAGTRRAREDAPRLPSQAAPWRQSNVLRGARVKLRALVNVGGRLVAHPLLCMQ